MKVLVIGDGQLGWELSRTVPSGVECVVLGIEDLDITDSDAVSSMVINQKPDVIVNAAAYTDVDKAEKETELAYMVNEDGSGNLARTAKENGCRFVHISTDFIFDGKSSTPYLPDSPAEPVSVYGASKLAGEKQVTKIYPENSIIIRTAWLYSANGNNFVKTMLRLIKSRDQFGVVADQIGTPTWANGLAGAIWKVYDKPEVTGCFHWSDSGVASWYDFAVAIQEQAFGLDIISKKADIMPIKTTDYPTPAARPAYSILDKTTMIALNGGPAPHWQFNLTKMLSELENE
jgi:dTDP-4-dehydrorhamnose reductase